MYQAVDFEVPLKFIECRGTGLTEQCLKVKRRNSAVDVTSVSASSVKRTFCEATIVQPKQWAVPYSVGSNIHYLTGLQKGPPYVRSAGCRERGQEMARLGHFLWA